MSFAFVESHPWGGGPVVVSVPHAGRIYDEATIAALAVPVERIRPLEDRYADMLTTDAAQRGHHVITAMAPRLVIDLNRAETDFDPARIAGGAPRPGRPSARARGGLGLIPDRLVGVGDVWRDRPNANQLVSRIATIHRPYHAAVADALERARQKHGFAVLIDLHSMPTLTDRHADVVIGDRFGQSARHGVRLAAMDVLHRAGLQIALNSPYAGGHIVERHCDRARRVDAIQFEFDRRLYLDRRHDLPGTGLAALSKLVGDIADAIAATGTAETIGVAAE